MGRSSGIRWRSNWIRVEYFPKISSLQILRELTEFSFEHSAKRKWYWEWFECVDMRIATDSILQPLSTQKNTALRTPVHTHIHRTEESCCQFCEDETSNLKISQTRSSLCQCSTKNTTPPSSADIKEVIAKLRETKEEAVAARQAFLIHMFLWSAEFDSVRSNNLNSPKNCARNWKHGETCCQLCQMCFITGELLASIWLRKIGGTGGKIGARRELIHCTYLIFLKNRFTISQNSDLHASEGGCKQYTYHSRIARNSFTRASGSRHRMLWALSIIPSRLKVCNHHLSRNYRHCRFHMQFLLTQHIFHNIHFLIFWLVIQASTHRRIRHPVDWMALPSRVHSQWQCAHLRTCFSASFLWWWSADVVKIFRNMVVHANQRNIRPQILTKVVRPSPHLRRKTFDLKLMCFTMRGLQRTRVCLSDLLDLCIMKSFSIGHNSVQWVLPLDTRKTNMNCKMVSVPALRQVQCEWIQSQRRSNRHINTLDFLPCVFVDPSHVVVERRIGFGPREATMASAWQTSLLCFVFSVSVVTRGGVVHVATLQKRFPLFRGFLLTYRCQSDFRSDIVVRLVRFVTVLSSCCVWFDLDSPLKWFCSFILGILIFAYCAFSVGNVVSSFRFCD